MGEPVAKKGHGGIWKTQTQSTSGWTSRNHMPRLDSWLWRI